MRLQPTSPIQQLINDPPSRPRDLSGHAAGGVHDRFELLPRQGSILQSAALVNYVQENDLKGTGQKNSNDVKANLAEEIGRLKPSKFGRRAGPRGSARRLATIQTRR
jgi:hypothetical protein